MWRGIGDEAAPGKGKESGQVPSMGAGEGHTPSQILVVTLPEGRVLRLPVGSVAADVQPGVTTGPVIVNDGEDGSDRSLFCRCFLCFPFSSVLLFLILSPTASFARVSACRSRRLSY